MVEELKLSNTQLVGFSYLAQKREEANTQVSLFLAEVVKEAGRSLDPRWRMSEDGRFLVRENDSTTAEHD